MSCSVLVRCLAMEREPEPNSGRSLVQVLSHSLSLIAEVSENPLASTAAYVDLPELQSDKEIENVLCQISELLTSNSIASSATDLNDSRSIDEILKEAESLVVERSRFSDDEGVQRREPLNSDTTDCSLELEPEENPGVVMPPSSTSNHPPSPRPPRQPSPEVAMQTDVAPNISNLLTCAIDSSATPLHPDDLSISTPPPSNAHRNPSQTKLVVANRSPSHQGGETVMDENWSRDAGPEVVAAVSNLVSSVGSKGRDMNSREGDQGASAPLPSSTLNSSQVGVVKNNESFHNLDVSDLKRIYEERIFSLEKQIVLLSSQLAEMERRRSSEENAGHSMMVEELQRRVKEKELQLTALQKDNQRLVAQSKRAAMAWLEAEKGLSDEIKRLERELKKADDLNRTEAYELREALNDAREEITKLEEQAIILQREKCEAEKQDVEKMENLKREVENARKEVEEMKARERRTAADHSLSTATLQGRLSQTNNQLAAKQTEVVRLNTDVTRLRGDLERARLGSVVTGGGAHNVSHQVRQLEVALERERENSRRAAAQVESLNKHSADLARQVKELEGIVRRRSRGLPWVGDEGLLSSSTQSQAAANLTASLESTNKKLQQELAVKERLLSENQTKLNDLQNKHDKELKSLEEKMREMSNSKRNSSSSVGSGGRGQRAAMGCNNAQLVATVRGLRVELNNRDKQVLKLTKELDETKKRLSRAHLNTSRLHHSTHHSNNNNNNNNSGGGRQHNSNNAQGSKVSRTPSVVSSSIESTVDYNPFLYQEDQETIVFLRNENSNLHEEVKRLEQDLISLHNMRVQESSDIKWKKEEGSDGGRRDVGEPQAKHNAQITHLRAQLYTQQMVINHLKNQIKLMEEKQREINAIKCERDRLEESLHEANKKVAALNRLSNPEKSDYEEMVEKLERLERRHETREAKLQGIVKELMAKQREDDKGNRVCTSANCKDRLYSKNREICYYRAEIDKILDSLAEFNLFK